MGKTSWIIPTSTPPCTSWDVNDTTTRFESSVASTKEGEGVPPSNHDEFSGIPLSTSDTLPCLRSRKRRLPFRFLYLPVK